MDEVDPPPVLLADADVLIDYAKSELRLLALIGETIGPVKILRQILDTVDQLTEGQCRELGIEVIEAPTELLLEAGHASGPLSFEDRLCLLTCKTNDWTCVSNDRVLLRTCKAEGIAHRRGLRLLLDLAQGRHITKQRALRVASAIAATNPHHINRRVLKAFSDELVHRRRDPLKHSLV